MTHDKPFVNMHVVGFMYKMGGHNQFVEEKHKGKGMKKKGRERKEIKRREEKKRERGRKGSQRFDGRNSSNQEVKSVYSTRVTLQEVEILPTLVYFPP